MSRSVPPVARRRRPHTSRRHALVALTALVVSCAPSTPRSAESKHATLNACDYDVTSNAVLALDVHVRCHGVTSRGFVAGDDLVARRIHGRSVDGRTLRTDGSKLLLDDGGSASAFDYRVDLDAIAVERDDPEIADRIGNSWIAPASTWLLRLEPTPVDTSVHVRVRGKLPFTTALERNGDGWDLLAHQLRTATYTVFGAFTESSVSVPGKGGAVARVRIAKLDGQLAVSDAVLKAWIARSAGAVGGFFHGFPADEALVAVVPTRGEKTVSWGALLPENGAGIALTIGQHAHKHALDADWILVHELFHIGVPSFIGEGKWLDEGLATYYEPIIRARLGALTELEVWSEFAHNMPRARASLREGLEKSDDWAARYWGGATVVLLADLEARRRSDGEHGLEDGVRRVLDAGGDARHIWKLERVYETIDDALDAPILSELGARYAVHGADVDFAHMFDELGVRVSGSKVTLSDSAPLASLRRAIVSAPRPREAR